MTNVDSTYAKLLQRCSNEYKSIFAKRELGELHTRSHNYLLDFETLHKSISHRKEQVIFSTAIKEYQLAMLALSASLYRYAFSGLRLSFELMLSTFLLSAKEIELNQWLRGKRDLNWNSIVDNERGLFSKNFISAFSEEMTEDGKEFGAIAVSLYREFSEFIHGNYSKEASLGTKIAFNENLFKHWHAQAETVRLIVVFGWASRYLFEIDPKAKAETSDILNETLGTLKGVQLYLAR